jgi:hypothetical protein
MSYMSILFLGLFFVYKILKLIILIPYLHGGLKYFLFSTLSRLVLWSTQPPIQWVPGAPSPGLKEPGREADNSPPANVEVKKMWIYTSTPPYAFMA